MTSEQLQQLINGLLGTERPLKRALKIYGIGGTSEKQAIKELMEACVYRCSCGYWFSTAEPLDTGNNFICPSCYDEKVLGIEYHKHHDDRGESEMLC